MLSIVAILVLSQPLSLTAFVAGLDYKPIEGVTLQFQGPANDTAPSDRNGKISFKIAGIKRGERLSLRDVQTPGSKLVIIDPWDLKVVIPVKTSADESDIRLFLGPKGSRELLRSERAMMAFLQRANLGPGEVRESRAEEAAVYFGLDLKDIVAQVDSLRPTITDEAFLGQIELFQDNYGLAADFFRKSIELNSIRVYEAKYGLSKSLIGLADYAGARTILEDLLKTDPTNVDVSLDLSLTMMETGDLKQAISSLLSLKDATKDPRSDQYSWLINNNLSIAYFQNSDLHTAVRYGLVAYGDSTENFGPGSLEQAIAALNLGVVYTELKNYQEADRYLKTGLYTLTNLRGERPLDYAKAMEALGRLEDAERKPGALEKVQEARRIRERLLPKNHPEVIRVLINEAVISQRLGEVKRAQELIELAVENVPRGPGHNELLVADAEFNAGAIYYQNRDFGKAVEMLKGASEIRTKVLGVSNLMVVETVGSLGLALANQKKWKEASRAFEQALKANRSGNETKDPNVGMLLNNLAVSYWRDGKTKNADIAFSKAIKFFEKYPGMTVGLKITLTRYGEFLKQEGREEEVAKIMKRISSMGG